MEKIYFKESENYEVVVIWQERESGVLIRLIECMLIKSGDEILFSWSIWKGTFCIGYYHRLGDLANAMQVYLDVEKFREVYMSESFNAVYYLP